MKKDIQDHSFYPLIASQSEKLSEITKHRLMLESVIFPIRAGSRKIVLDRLDAKVIDSNTENLVQTYITSLVSGDDAKPSLYWRWCRIVLLDAVENSF